MSQLQEGTATVLQGQQKLVLLCAIVVVSIEPFSLGNREINILRVKCSNANRGCEWVGTVGTIEKHVATCGFTLVPCPKQCKDDKNEVKCFTRKEVDDHLKNDCPNRDYECQSKCGEKGTYAYITEVHDKTCKMRILPCPNDGCDTEIQRQQASEHVSKCPHTVIPCKYKGIGCDTELKREDMAAHEQEDKLLHKALERVHKAQKTINSQQSAIASLQATVQSLQNKVDSLEKNRLVLNKVDSLEKNHLVLKNKKPETFRLSEYRKKKEANEYFQSTPFYTHPNGYHMALRVYANGDGAGKGTHVSVYAVILEGEYDAELKWPFVGEVTITLLNQLEDENHHTKVGHFYAVHNHRVGSSYGHPKFTPHSGLSQNPAISKNTQYLQNDTLYFRVSLEVSDHKPWLE